jgi:hypothetical protein
MKTVWTKGLTPEQAIACRGDFVGAAPLRERLTALLEAKANEKRKATRSGNSYDNPNWALVQADAIGYEKALYEVISLISSENV